MNNKGTLIKDFKQELLHTILIPFYIENDQEELKKINLEDFVENSFSEKKLIKKNSQFYDYIENLYLSETVSEFEGKDELIDDFEKKLFLKSKYKIKEVFVQSIDELVAIFGITIKFKKIYTLENIHLQKLNITRIIKQSKIKNYISDLFKLTKEYKIRYFDSYDSNNEKLSTVRFYTFTTIIKKHSEIKLSNDEKLNIANYFLDRMAVSAPVNNKVFTHDKPICGGELFISSEGVLFIYEKSKENNELSEIFIDSKFIRKGLLITYLMNLQEYLKLHYLKFKANETFCIDKKIETSLFEAEEIGKKINKLNEKLVFFSIRHHLTKISSFEWIRNVYTKIYDTLEIEKYIIEVNNSFSLYKQYIEKIINEEKYRIEKKQIEIDEKREKRNKKIEWYFKFFSCITLCNALISILFNFVNVHIGNNTDTIKILNILFYWIGIIVCVLSAIVPQKYLKLNDDEKNNKKVDKKVDKK